MSACVTTALTWRVQANRCQQRCQSVCRFIPAICCNNPQLTQNPSCNSFAAKITQPSHKVLCKHEWRKKTSTICDFKGCQSGISQTICSHSKQTWVRQRVNSFRPSELACRNCLALVWLCLFCCSIQLQVSNNSLTFFVVLVPCARHPGHPSESSHASSEASSEASSHSSEHLVFKVGSRSTRKKTIVSSALTARLTWIFKFEMRVGADLQRPGCVWQLSTFSALLCTVSVRLQILVKRRTSYPTGRGKG